MEKNESIECLLQQVDVLKEHVDNIGYQLLLENDEQAHVLVHICGIIISVLHDDLKDHINEFSTSTEQSL